MLRSPTTGSEEQFFPGFERERAAKREDMDGLVTKTRSIPWRGVLALIGGFLIQVCVFVHFVQVCLFTLKKILVILFISALSWLFLLVWQHDDLSYILHEVSFVINRKNHSVMHFKWLTPVLKAPRVSRLDLW